MKIMPMRGTSLQLLCCIVAACVFNLPLTVAGQNAPQPENGFSVTMQIGRGGQYYFNALTEVTKNGAYYSRIKLTFDNMAGTFGPSGPIFLDPQNPRIQNIVLGSAQQQITIKSATVSFATPDQDGSLFLDCSYTNYLGVQTRNFNQIIAVWSFDGKPRAIAAAR